MKRIERDLRIKRNMISMDKKFNLLMLHDETDLHPRSWICLKGEGLEHLITKLEIINLKKFKTTREGLSRILAKEFDCSTAVIKRVLQKKRYIPIAIILKLLENASHKDRLVAKINKATEWLKVNGGSAKTVKACKKLSLDLAKILGAFMADGSMHNTLIFCSKENAKLDVLKKKLQLHKIKYIKKYAKSRKEHYVDVTLNKQNYEFMRGLIKKFSKDFNIQTHTNLELIDYYKEDVEAFNSWMHNQFGIYPLRFYKKKNENAWTTFFCNKILSRYLIKFFDVIPGPKSYTAFEPSLIKNSNLKVRKEFAKGVMMFDGCISMAGYMNLQSNSPSLIASIKDIFEKDGIKYMNTRNKRVVQTTSKNNMNKIASYFERDTHKYKRIEVIRGKRPIEAKFDSYSDISLASILKTIKKAEYCDVKFLMKKFKVKNSTTIMTYLRVLEKQRLIKLELKTNSLNTKVLDEKLYIKLKSQLRHRLFARLKNKFKEHQKAAVFLGTNKKAFSLWKLGKSRIPLPMLMRILEIAEMDKKEIANNIESTDRLVCSAL